MSETFDLSGSRVAGSGMDQYDETTAVRPLQRQRPRRLSDVFVQLAAEADGPVTIAAIRDALGDRSFAALLVFFACLNLLPLPPGTSAVLGIPLVIVSAQMVYGSHTAWLPAFLMRKSFTEDQFRALSARLLPHLVRLERLVRPRWWPFWTPHGDRIIGAIALVLATAVVLPVPLGNWLPAFAIALIGLALSERDGLLFAIGATIGVISLVIVAAVIASAGAVLGYVWHAAGMHAFW